MKFNEIQDYTSNLVAKGKKAHKKLERKMIMLKTRLVWPRVLGMIFKDMIVLSCIIFLSGLGIVSILDSYIIKNNNDCEKIVSTINENWHGENTLELEKKIKNAQNLLDTVGDVYIIDSEFNVLASYENETVDKKDSTDIKSYFVNSNNAIKATDAGVLVRSTISKDIQSNLRTIKNDSIRSLFMPFFKTLHFFKFSNSSNQIEWASEIVAIGNQWVLYETEFPNTYICIKNLYLLNQFHASFCDFLVCFFGLFLVFCVFFEILKVISYISDSRKIEKLTTTDIITGGKNKSWFITKAKRKIRSRKRLYAVVQITMEKYHNYCASYGVKEAENLLELFNAELEQLVNRKELVCHVEKADFALLLTYETEELLNNRINEITSNLATIRSGQHLTFASGVVKVNSKKDDINSLLSATSLALHKTENTTEKIVWFNDSMNEEQIWERRIEDDMEKALNNHEFKLFLQPKYSTKDENLAAAEALVRWIHPELGFISPGKFIPIFETNGFILKLDDYMLTAVAEQQAKWLAEGKKLVPISVNVSRVHFTCENLAEEICQIVDKYQVPHQFIELELTESAFFDDKVVLLQTVKKLKNYDFTVSMDDFGAGYSSLNSLKELPLDVIKLDAEFFRKIDDVDRANLIVGDTISLAKKLGMQIVAEGIETREQVDFLANQNCDLIQGFYFAKPLPINEFEERAYPKN